ncbi:MAG: hypothetical protein ABI136_05015 [Ginsengibacter sp.]
MKIIITQLFFFMAILANTKCFSQENESPDLTNLTKVTFFNPGISYEKRIAKLQSLYAQLFMNTSFSIGYSDTWGATSDIRFDPAATLQYRYYYNSGQRAAKGKTTEMNNLNYVSLISETSIITEKIFFVDHVKKNHPALNKFSIVWGLQRNYKSRFSLDLNVGPSYFFGNVTSQNNAGQLTTEKEDEFTIAGQINLGFWLNKRN